MSEEKNVTIRIKVYGIVQGVGFRPTVARHAASAGITGSVCNKGPYVEIFAQGKAEAVRYFADLLEKKPPRRAAVLKMDIKNVDDRGLSFSSFEIIESERTKGEIFISPDIAICDDCKRELFDPGDRRYLHPFINCTCCGPRLTILDALPYDRVRTSMKMFPMCAACEREYHSPQSRRYDAQPVCCNDCGPEVYLAGREEVRGSDAITHTRRIIAEGGIAAVKGIGGFHLCCDASNEEAVSKLRARKNRPVKPFAVMMRDEKAVERECMVSPAQRAVITGHQKPILLLTKKTGGKLCQSIAPGNPAVGVMLPYAPVQLLLFDYPDGISMPDCLVMTSGNISGAPICRDDESAVRELGGFCDEILSHDRAIRIRADDTVLDRFEGGPYMIRRSRGYAPLPVLLTGEAEGCVLAIGGELKNTFCVSRGQLMYLSPYVGDLEDIRTQEALRETVRRFLTLLECRPEAIACDLHPGYHSTEIAETLAEEYGVPLMRIQHHYAHILSCMAENDEEGPVIGVSFDGTGYGTDGTIWGGEILTCTRTGFTRRMSIAPFRQTGGEAAVREGWRIAVSLLYEAAGDPETVKRTAAELELCTPAEAGALMRMADGGINTVISTSAGRLFDAVSAVLGICRRSTFEGEASTGLQFAAEEWEASLPEAERAVCRELPAGYPAEELLTGAALSGEKGSGTENGRGMPLLGTYRLFRYVLAERMAGADPRRLAWEFHVILASQIREACRLVREETGIGTAALSGGVFQNTLLLGLTAEGLRRDGFRVLTHHLVPPNDGGIALGQAAAASCRSNRAGGEL